MKKLLPFLLLLFVVTTSVFAQQEVVGIPYSFLNNISYNVDRVDLPDFNADEVAMEDAERAKNNMPLRIGIVHNVEYTMKNCGRIDILPNGATLWRATFSSPGALSMAVSFTRFNIPEEASLHIYSGDRRQLTGKYTNDDVQYNGFMVSDDIYGDELTIEYYEPADVTYHGDFEITRISHIYNDPTLEAYQNSDISKGYWGTSAGKCHTNASCPIANPWKAQVNSVVCIRITTSEGVAACSGSMINNVRMDKKPYVLSANHCSTSDKDTYQFIFNYQTNGCQSTAGFFNRVAKGGVVRAKAGLNEAMTNLYESADFLLLEITGNIPTETLDSLYFAGWDATGILAGPGAVIHHPGADYKKISFVDRVVNMPGMAYMTKFWTVYWKTGYCTEPGSSGSPLFNASKMIVGDLSTGSSSCDSTFCPDNFGKISFAWTNKDNPDPARKLKPWLDPDNTGALTLPGMHYNGRVGVEDAKQVPQTFSIFPNPSTGNVTFRGVFDSQDAVCNVYNTMGMLVDSRNVALNPSFSIDFKGLPNGIYVVELLSAKNVYKSKMIIAQ